VNRNPEHLPDLDPRIAAYVSSSYPHNLDYRVVRGALKPRWKLRSRLGRFQALYPDPLDDLLDLSSSKGYFVLDAARRASCRRALGIDVHPPDVEASTAVAAHLGLDSASFLLTTLRELSKSIDDHGGPFRTVLLINTYPYLFFGSERSEATAHDHEELFRLLATVTAERLIFSNRVNLEVLPRHIQSRARDLQLDARYNEEQIRTAAEAHFEVQELRPVKRIPLWLLLRR
jgi:hypothetical protein